MKYSCENEMFIKQGFILLNLDYDGRGDFYSNLISENSKYGQLESTDAVWVKDPKYAIKNFTIEEIIKYSCFLILNNGIDVALYVLKNTTSPSSSEGNIESPLIIADFLKPKLNKIKSKKLLKII